VQQKRKRAASTSALGDADSVVVTISGDTTTFSWRGKIDASVGTATGVRAAVFAIDSGDGGTAFGDTSNITVSAASVAFGIDADRPAGPNKLPYNGTSWNGHLAIDNVTISGSDTTIISSQEALVNENRDIWALAIRWLFALNWAQASLTMLSLAIRWTSS
jgi:hypothetical protein